MAQNIPEAGIRTRRLILKEVSSFVTSLAVQKRELANCALVCTMWTPIAQELMWEKVELHEYNAEEFLSSAGTGREVTKSIAVDSDSGVDATTLDSIFEKVRGLEALNLGGKFAASLGSPSLIGLKHLSLSELFYRDFGSIPITQFNLTSLQIFNWGPFSTGPFPDHFLASSRPTLQHLKINYLSSMTLHLIRMLIIMLGHIEGAQTLRGGHGVKLGKEQMS
ncbi:hypothetical protein RQP46_001355 [Phenoliferia psychrophenolica]